MSSRSTDSPRPTSGGGEEYEFIRTKRPTSTHNPNPPHTTIPKVTGHTPGIINPGIQSPGYEGVVAGNNGVEFVEVGSDISREIKKESIA